ncbi:MAG: site-specific DNA-methyltransferase [Deltaproteobacteria bacterium]|nr:site-specific DNA-methyltransferase [Deltaproteobacteria bacterium]
MRGARQKLELTWIGKESRPRLEPRILLEDPDVSYASPRGAQSGAYSDNMLIQGDNLLALKALEAEFSGKVKCVCIDPPYNTGAAFQHYEDGIEHSIWLGLMRERLESLRRLLRSDGVIFVHIDDTEHAYLKVLMDEVFGRRNYCGQFVWEKKKKPSFLNANMGVVTEFILAYSPDRTQAPPFVGGLTTEGKKYPLNNAGNSLQVLRFPAGSVRFRCPDGRYQPQDMSEGNIVTRLLDEVVVEGGTNREAFRLEGEWRYSQKRLDEIVAAGEELVISRVPFRPNHIKAGGDDKKLKNLLSIAHYQMATYEDSNAESIALFGREAFDYPKPEKLVQLLIDAVTEEGDLVLDSFLGSGTTAAVAHKTRRRWIGIELGDHAVTHCVPRLRKVVDGEDPGGITGAVGWNGGGGFRFYRLAPSLLARDRWGNWVIAEPYRRGPDAGARLAEAVCKLEGFRYSPSQTAFWQHGQSTERDYIYVTTQTLTHEQLQGISDEVGPERTLLVCCSAFGAKPDMFPNLTVKRIPAAVLARCEWGRDDYSLNVQRVMSEDALPEPTSAPAKPGTTPATRRKKRVNVQELLLFGTGGER